MTEPLRVQIKVSKGGRGTFVLNGQDISKHVQRAVVTVVACKYTFVTFDVMADDIELDAEALPGNQEITSGGGMKIVIDRA